MVLEQKEWAEKADKITDMFDKMNLGDINDVLIKVIVDVTEKAPGTAKHAFVERLYETSKLWWLKEKAENN